MSRIDKKPTKKLSKGQKKEATIYGKEQSEKTKFISVAEKYNNGKNGDIKKYFKDLEAEKKYVSENVVIKRVWVEDKNSSEYKKAVKKKGKIVGYKTVVRKEKYGIEVYDSKTGQILNTNKFKKYFNLKESEINFITNEANVSKDGTVTESFNRFLNSASVNIKVDFRDIEDLQKYEINFNDEVISIIELEQYTREGLSNIDYYVFKYDVQLTKDGKAVIEVDFEEIEGDFEEGDSNSYTDSFGNFILYKS